MQTATASEENHFLSLVKVGLAREAPQMRPLPSAGWPQWI